MSSFFFSFSWLHWNLRPWRKAKPGATGEKEEKNIMQSSFIQNNRAKGRETKKKEEKKKTKTTHTKLQTQHDEHASMHRMFCFDDFAQKFHKQKTYVMITDRTSKWNFVWQLGILSVLFYVVRCVSIFCYFRYSLVRCYVRF